MKNIRNNILKTGLIVITGIFVGFLLLSLAYLVPTGKIRTHIKESIPLLESEGENPYLIENYKGSSLDNYTDEIMLCIAGFQSERPFYKAAMIAERKNMDEEEPLQWLKSDLLNEGEGYTARYSRYWHGYLIFLKPLFYFLNYSQIRKLNSLFFGLVLFLLAIAFARRKMWFGIYAEALAILTLFPGSIPYSFQFSSCFYVAAFAEIGLLWDYEKLEEKGWLGLYFCGIGIFTSFFDLLTYPVITVGFSLIIFTVLCPKEWSGCIRNIILYGISWACGYVGMWAGKWIIGTVVTGENLFADAVKSVKVRTSGSTDYTELGISDVIGRNADVLNNAYGKMIVMAGLIVVVIVFSVTAVLRKTIDYKKVFLLIMLSLIPIVWYCGTANHSYIHYWYTFRDLSVTVFAVTMIPEMLVQSMRAEKSR